ncbi:hypothetical protein O2K51_06645 [Apibacter raozihei]|uniref:hypothetical protein n=1 Tax=Apibacter TaxID=1778601 RepID=UPI000FE3AADC|nr:MULTISPECIES: hypothetical protein [Apibacter]
MKTFNIISKVLCLAFVLTGFLSCGDKAALSESTAVNAVEKYLKSYPIYETTEMEIGEVRFKIKRDEQKLVAYKNLASKGYINFELSKQKKKFLSKDSIYIYEVKLTDKARPFVFKQKKEKVEVKTYEYQLDEKEQAKIELSGKKSGNAVVTLQKINTDFAELTADKNPHSSFITKSFTLKYKKEEGWVVTKDK